MSTASIPAPPSTRKPSWRTSPQHVWLRRALFQIHLWAGLLVTLYAIAIGLSGSALVFRTEIEQHLHPQLVHLTPTPRRVSLQATIDRVQAERPGWVVSALLDVHDPTVATTLLLHRKGGTLDANYRGVSIDPYTGAVLLDQMRFAGLLGWLSNLHYYLLLGEKGLLFSGGMAFLLFILCLTGLVVWWPGIHRWRSALILRPHVRWRRLNWDLHAVIGFWFSASLLVLSLTGLYFAFPGPVAKIVLFATHSSPEIEPHEAPPRHPSLTPTLAADRILQTARQLLPTNAPPDYITLPTHPSDPIYATGYYAGTAPYSQLRSVTFDSTDGTLLSSSDTHQQSRGTRLIQLSYALHFGSFAGEGPLGLAVKLLWVAAGLAPALLAITGVLMFANRKLLPMRRQRLRRRAALQRP